MNKHVIDSEEPLHGVSKEGTFTIFVDKENQAQRGQVTYLKPHIQ